MYVAMNRFRISEGREAEFEQTWRERDSHLDEVPGFQQFQLVSADGRLRRDDLVLFGQSTGDDGEADSAHESRADHQDEDEFSAHTALGSGYLGHRRGL